MAAQRRQLSQRFSSPRYDEHRASALSQTARPLPIDRHRDPDRGIDPG
jgi:hypothetical protein